MRHLHDQEFRGIQNPCGRMYVLVPYLILKAKLDAATWRNDKQQDAEDIKFPIGNFAKHLKSHLSQYDPMRTQLVVLHYPRLRNDFLKLSIDTFRDKKLLQKAESINTGPEAEMMRHQSMGVVQ